MAVAKEAPTTLADALKSLKQGVARRFVGDADHCWQKRYYDFNVRNEAQFVEKLHYIHSNPVNAGLCAARRIGRGAALSITRLAATGGPKSSPNGPRENANELLETSVQSSTTQAKGQA